MSESGSEAVAGKPATFKQVRDVLIQRRRRLNWSQADLGSRLGMSGQMVSYLETRVANKSLQGLVRWAAALGVDVELRLLASDGRTLFVSKMVEGDGKEGG